MLVYICFYIITVVLSYLLARDAAQTKARRPNISYKKVVFGSFIVMWLFIGCRYGVGRDYPAYALDYRDTTLWDFGTPISKYKYEYGYYAILLVARFFDMGPQMLFIIASGLTLFLFFRLFRNRIEYLPIAILVFFIALPYTFIINGLRQGIAIMCFLNSLEYLQKNGRIFRDCVCYLLWILIASLFHTSALYLIVLLVLKLDLIQNRFSSVILCALAVSGLLLNIVGLSDLFLPNIEDQGGYSYGAIISSDDRFQMESEGLSLGKLLSLTIYLIPLFFYDQIKKRYSNYHVSFIMLAIGSAVFYMFPNNIFATRVAYYFLFSEVLIYPILFRYLLKDSPSSTHSLVCVVIFLGFVLIQLKEFGGFYQNQIWPNASIFGFPIK